MKKLFLALIFFISPSLCLAAAGDTSAVEMFQCELKEGKTMKEVQANNTRWLALTRKEAGTENVSSHALQSTVGDLSKFVFADIYPDLASWAAAKSAEESEEGKAIEDTFNELMECTKNRLYKSTEH